MALKIFRFGSYFHQVQCVARSDAQQQSTCQRLCIHFLTPHKPKANRKSLKLWCYSQLEHWQCSHVLFLTGIHTCQSSRAFQDFSLFMVPYWTSCELKSLKVWGCQVICCQNHAWYRHLGLEFLTTSSCKSLCLGILMQKFCSLEIKFLCNSDHCPTS